jgi:DNA polymerase III subunit gamma/tau
MTTATAPAFPLRASSVPGFDPTVPPLPRPDPGTDSPPNPIPAPEPDREPQLPPDPLPKPEPVI